MPESERASRKRRETAEKQEHIVAWGVDNLLVQVLAWTRWTGGDASMILGLGDPTRGHGDAWLRCVAAKLPVACLSWNACDAGQ